LLVLADALVVRHDGGQYSNFHQFLMNLARQVCSTGSARAHRYCRSGSAPRAPVHVADAVYEGLTWLGVLSTVTLLTGFTVSKLVKCDLFMAAAENWIELVEGPEIGVDEAGKFSGQGRGG
jgi:hypothetical protein